MKFSVLQQNRIVYSNSIQGKLLCISSNRLGNKTVISCLFVVYGTVDDLMHYFTWPSASCNSASGRPQHFSNSFDYTKNWHELTVYYI